MSSFTKEQLIARINQVTAINNYRISRDPDADGLAMDNELFAIALASLEAELVGYFGRFDADDENLIDQCSPSINGAFPLYTAPPAPVAMKDHQIRDLVNELRDIAVEYYGTQKLRERIAKTVRAAMLQGADGNSPAHSGCRPAQNCISPAQDGNNPVITDGWVACSERMPEDGEKVLTSFRGGMRTAFCKVVDVLGHKIFVDELTLFNGVPADHWQPLPAAPQQEVK